MLNKTRNHLIRLYTITAGAILTAVFIVIAIFSSYQTSRAEYELFTNHIFTLHSKLQNDNTISDSWLSNLESNNQLIISINDNGNPLFFSGMWTPKTPRSDLIGQIEEQAIKDGIHLTSRPISADSIQSRIYKITGDFSDHYYGSALVIAKKGGYCSLILLQNIDNSFQNTLHEYLLYVLLDFLGILSLFLLIRALVDRMLKPIQDNQQRQTQFIAAASHELRSPVAVIKANNVLPKTTSEAYDTCEQIIDSECNRMSRLINDLLLLASGDANTWTIQKENINIDTLILDTYESVLIRANEKHIQLNILLPEEDLPSISGDHDRLLQVFTILIDNAISYSKEGSSIEFKVVREKKFLSFSIIDHGIGIKDHDKPLVFDRFYRVDQSRKDKSHFGLGLSIAKELISLHQGSIHITDTIGGGATFTILLPCLINLKKSVAT